MRQEDTVGRVLDGESRLRVPVPPVADGFGEDDLAFAGEGRGEGVRVWHGGTEVGQLQNNHEVVVLLSFSQGVWN